MRIWEWAVRRGVSTFMIYALALILGAVAVPKIPLEFMPRMDMPFVEVHVPYEGASPIDVCDRIVEPIEEAVSTLPGIKKVRSRCRSGYAYIGVEMSDQARMDFMVLDLQERIDAIRKELPSDLRQILIQKFDTEQMPVIFGALTFPQDRPENNDLMDRYVVRPLKTVDGVADVQLEGLETPRVLVELSQDKLTAYGINVVQLFEALTSANLTLSAGTVNLAGRKHNLRLAGEFRDLEEIRRLPVTATVKVGDVADVRLDYVKPFFIGRINRQRAYMLMVLKESGANTVQVCREVNARLAELLHHPRLRGVRLKIWFDQSREITSSVDILTQSGIAGALLAFFVIWLFLRDFRTTLIISLSIPVSIVCTIACMYFLGLSFNLITLSAMIVAIGMLVDNSIVVLEAVDLSHRQGRSPVRAALEGAGEVGLAITVSTTTTLIVFLPLAFSENSAAATMMKQLGTVLALSIGMSLVVSLTLIPLLFSRLLSAAHRGLPRWWLAVSGGFSRLLAASLRRRFRALAAAALAFFLAIQLFLWPLPWDKVFPRRQFRPLIQKEAVPRALMRMVRISIRFERKPPLPEMDEKMKKLEDLFLEKKEEWDLDTVAAIVSPVFVRLLLVLPDDRTPRYSAAEIKEKAEALLAERIHWPGVTFDTSGEGMGEHPGMETSTSIKVRGLDPDQVYSFAEMIRQKLNGLPGLKPIKPLERTDEDELHVMVQRDLARLYGFDLSQVAMAVSYSIRGVPVGQLHSGDIPLDIYLQVEEADRRSPAQLESMMIQNLRGEFIPLSNIARFRRVPIPEIVRRDNRLITVRIPIEPEGVDLGEVQKRVAERLGGLRLPIGYSWIMGEEFIQRSEDLKTLAQSLLLAVILVFLIMTAQFESAFLPFVIMFTMPFAAIGVVLGLLAFQATFNILSGAGCLLLVGIVVNNAIVLVDHIHNLRKRGLSETDSLIQGAQDRLRPIMMTALTTIVGLFPMALGLNDTGRMMYSPMAVAVLGGLTTSTFLTPFLIPLIYSLTDDLVHAFRRMWQILREV